MATYFHGNTEIQSANSGQDGLQTLVLMNPTGYIPYSDTPPPHQSSSAGGNLVFLNSAAATLAHHHAPSQQQQHQQHFLSSGGADMTGFHHGFLPQRVHYNVWTPPPETPSPSARDTPRAGTPLQQGLSLTLSSQQLGFGSPHAPQSADEARGVSVASSAVSGVTTGGGAGMQSVLLSSKYLRAAQELLDEVVNVGAGIGADVSGKKSNAGGGSKSVGESSGATASGDGGKISSAAELTPAERQEVQMKKAKLIAMLDEVEQRYRQYHQQMQIVICSFEQAAGIGSARTYTALALQTISKQFRCLKDAIAGQIRATGKSLGEDTDGGGGGGGAGSRLKFVDHHLRQQRALQQLGMIQHNAWRPQRGLPERSVSVLRAWLFEHFLHPYPKDSDKHMLAKQTGLTRSQVSNWFINARVRLWKPMVEEMYLEEIKEQNGGQAPENKVDNSSNPSKLSPNVATTEPRDNNIDPSASPSLVSPRPGGFSLVGSSELDGITIARNSPKKARCGDGDGDTLTSPNAHHHLTVDMKADEDNDGDNDEDGSNQVVSIGRDGYSFMGGHQTNFIGGFGQYPIPEIGRPFEVSAAPDAFTHRYSSDAGINNNNNNNNGFSLTLGLPHHHLSLSGGSHHHQHQRGFVQAGPVIQLGGGTGGGGGGIRRVDHLHQHQLGEMADQFDSINAPHSSSAAAAAFDAINIQNPKRFAAQLLPDYVS